MCKEAVASLPSEDAARVSQAFEYGILAMMGLPFVLLGVVGALLYRGYRKQRDSE